MAVVGAKGTFGGVAGGTLGNSSWSGNRRRELVCDEVGYGETRVNMISLLFLFTF